MSGVQHTSGPWQYSPRTGRVAYDAPDNCSPVATVHQPYGGDRQQEANGHLIAAAPDMLRDLIAAEQTFRWYGDLHAAKPDPDKAARNYAMADRLAATISKARGA